MLISLERELLDPAVRENPQRLAQLLDDDFYEISANGLMFNKSHVLSRLPREKVPQFYNQASRDKCWPKTLPKSLIMLLIAEMPILI